MPANNRYNWMTDILWITLLISLFYACWLGSYPLFTPDEGRYTEAAREMLATGDFITPRVDGIAFLDKPILYYWLQAAALKLFGIKEWAVRFFPALIGLLGCLVTYLAGRQLFDRRTGILSAIILGSSPLYFAGAHYANLDLEVAVFIGSSLMCVCVAIQREGFVGLRYLLAAYIFAALAFLTKGMIAIVFPAMIVGLWIIFQWRWNTLRQLHLATGFIIMSAIALPWYFLEQQVNPEFFHYFFVTQQVTRFLSGAEFNNKSYAWFYAPVVIAGFFPWVIYLFQALINAIKNVIVSKAAHPTEMFLLIWIIAIFTFFSIPTSKIVGYILPIFPALALLTGRYLSEIWTHPNFNPMYIAVTIFTILGGLLGILLLLLPNHHWVSFNVEFTPYIFMMAMTIFISVFASLFAMRTQTMLVLFTICLFCSATLLLTLTKGATHLNSNTAKPLVNILKPILKPQDEVVHYYKFYQDVPLYLEKRVTLVANWNDPNIEKNDNWVRELWYGKFYQSSDAWLISEHSFWKRWNSNKRLFVFLNTSYLSQFKSHAPYYYVIGKENNILLLSNQIGLI